MENNFLEDIIKVLIYKGLSLDESKELLIKNPKLLEYSPKEILKKLNVVFEGEDVYAVMFCDNNVFYWTKKSFDDFEMLFSKEYKYDYVVGNILNNILSKKFKNFTSSEKTIEEKMIRYREIVDDTLGYKIK